MTENEFNALITMFLFPFRVDVDKFKQSDGNVRWMGIVSPFSTTSPTNGIYLQSLTEGVWIDSNRVSHLHNYYKDFKQCYVVLEMLVRDCSETDSLLIKYNEPTDDSFAYKVTIKYLFEEEGDDLLALIISAIEKLMRLYRPDLIKFLGV